MTGDLSCGSPPVDIEDALDAGYRRLREACDEARRVLLDSQAGRLPSHSECPAENHWLLDRISRAERDVDRLRAYAQAVRSSNAARRASSGAALVPLDHVARREREAARLLGLHAG